MPKSSFHKSLKYIDGVERSLIFLFNYIDGYINQGFLITNTFHIINPINLFTTW